MKTTLHFLLFLAILITTPDFYSQQRIAAIHTPHVVLLDPDTGVILDATFIDLSPLNQGTPKAVIQVGNEIWVTDQLRDRIDRFNLQGTHLGALGGQVANGGLDNIRGLGIVNGNEVWVTNAGTNNGAPGDGIVRMDFAGNVLGFIPVSPSASPFDIIDNMNGEVYISYSSSDNIERRDYSGNALGNIVQPGQFNFFQQIHLSTNSSILAAVFSQNTSTGNLNGLYRLSETNGAILNYWALGNLRGVTELGNGEILWTSASGINKLDPSTGNSTLLSSGSAQYFGRLSLCTQPAAPSGTAEQTFNQGATLQDIVLTPSGVFWFATQADAVALANALPPDTLLTDGTTYYAVTENSGCYSSSFAVTVTVTLGVADFDGFALQYYPNPTKGTLVLRYEKEISQVTVHNLLGQEVLKLEYNSPEVQLDLSRLPSATYLVTVLSEEKYRTIRVIKN